ncbi:hypothetical protein N431DRAFT_339089, partial [Stipitochalara longipes BDJ]
MKFSVIAALATFLPSLTRAVSSTDEYQDGDTAQSGYLPNHNIDPAALSSYVHAWTYTCNSNEFYNAKPLTYTPSSYTHELVIFASQQNIVRVIDGLSGQLLFSRTLDPPFQASDSDCGDISPTIGITGTPVIDPATDIMYFFSKGYKNGATGPVNTLAGQYKFYAVQLPALTNVPGYPIIIDNHFASNDPTRYFVGGTLLQRPGLVLMGNSIVGGFGGHCDNFNYTGMLVSVHKSAAIINDIQAMVASPGGPAEQNNYMSPTGGKAGIWQGGMGLAVNGNNVYFATGNGVGAGVNKGTTPYSGKVYSSTLEQVVAKFTVDPSTGKLTQADWFEPFNFDTQLDGNDRDMASAGVALLDRTTFNAPGVGVNGIAVASGKDGIVYVMNADNLGGFYNGAGNPPDASMYLRMAALQQITIAGGSFYGGVASSPIDGGYLYFCPTGGPLYAYSYGLDGNGNPKFTLAGQIQTSPSNLACNGNPTVTSLNGQSGTGVVWLSDVNVGVIAFHAVPVNGVLVQIPLGWASGRLSKYQRPAFGNRRVYTTEQNMLYAIGPP